MTMPLPNTRDHLSPRIVKPSENLNAEELLSFMNTNGVSKTELSQLLGVTVQAINLWLKGERPISVVVSRLIRLFANHPQLIREF